MKERLVKDLMIPVGEYATVGQGVRLIDAIRLLEERQKTVAEHRQPYRAVLVVGYDGKIVGKIGHLGFLKALEPRYNVVKDIDKLAKTGLSAEFISSMMEHFNLWRDDIFTICKQAQTIKVQDVMHHITESIDENAKLTEAIHKIVMWQTLSLLVTKNNEVVGILRLSDLFEEVSQYILSQCEAGQ
ncbi:CBS domain-containing protein [candidate division KSB1 bacterium]